VRHSNAAGAPAALIRHQSAHAGEDSAHRTHHLLEAAAHRPRHRAAQPSTQPLLEIDALSLPADDSGKARVLLQDLLETFHEPNSTHPISGPTENAGIENVFLMPVPSPAPSTGAPSPAPQSGGSGTLAIVDFTAAFAASQPSGIEPETLTLLSIIGTLHANLPAITQVRFLIDGRTAQTLAGHADLTRTYLVTDTTTGPTHP